MTAGLPPALDAVPEGEPDAMLAARWQCGDLNAADTIIRRHTPRLLAFLSSRTTNRHDAEDLVQEVFFVVSRKIALYRTDQPFTPWLYSIARHKLADAWRAHRPAESFSPHHEPPDFRTPASLHAESDRAALLWRDVFARLPENQASALWLRIQEDLSVEAIATALEVSIANAKVLLFRARKTLSQAWKLKSI